MILFLDTETTGLKDPRLCQVAWKVGDGETKEALFKPPKPIEIEAMSITHITNKMVADKPAFDGSPEKAEIQGLLNDHVLVAHNAKFDVGVLKNDGVETKWFIDTQKVAMAMIECEKYNLQYLRYFLDLDVEATAHDAKGDVDVLAKLFAVLHIKVLESLGGMAQKTEIWNEMVRITRAPQLLRKVTFGKFSPNGSHGKPDGSYYTWEELAQVQPGYLEWMMRAEGSKPVEEQDENLMHTLKTYMR